MTVDGEDEQTWKTQENAGIKRWEGNMFVPPHPPAMCHCHREMKLHPAMATAVPAVTLVAAAAAVVAAKLRWCSPAAADVMLDPLQICPANQGNCFHRVSLHSANLNLVVQCWMSQCACLRLLTSRYYMSCILWRLLLANARASAATIAVA